MSACTIQPDGTTRCDPPDVFCVPPEVRVCSPALPQPLCRCEAVRPVEGCTALVTYPKANPQDVQVSLSLNCSPESAALAIAVLLARILAASAP